MVTSVRLLLLFLLLCRTQGRREGGRGPGQIQKAGKIQIVQGGSGGMSPENFEVSHALKCVLEASEAPFCACIQYIHTCKLPSSFSSFRSKSTTYGALRSSYG